MDRDSFRRLALLRLAEAKALLKSGHYHGAYYLCGYAVECALMACLARKTQRFSFPPEPDVVRQRYYTHQLAALLKQIGDQLAGELTRHRRWPEVSAWAPQSRYELGRTEEDARLLFSAIAHRSNGVLRCIRKYW